jgi:hypothetical protein
MWGTTPPCAKLTGDSANGFEAALIGDCRLFRPLAEIQPQDFSGLLQHYLPPTDMRTIEMKEAANRRSKEKAARKRLLNSNLTIVDQAKRNADFAFRR